MTSTRPYPDTETDVAGPPGGDGRPPLARRRKWPRRLLIGANIFVAMCILATAAAYGYLRWQVGDFKTFGEAVDRVLSEEPEGPKAPMNVLLVGSDTRGELSAEDAKKFGNTREVGGQRSDTVIILRIEPAKERAAMLSIPRDLYVPIAGTDHSARINNAFEAGPDRLIGTVKQALGIPIHHYVEMDFNGFRAIVEAVGGVPVYFPSKARDTVSGLRIDTPGCVTLSGEQALAFVRSRNYQHMENGRWQTDPTADIGRIQRQQDFVRRVVRKAGQRAKGLNFVSLQKLVNAGKKNVTIDSEFSTKDIVGLAWRFRSLESNAVEMLTVPTADARIGGAAVLRMKQPDAQQVIDRFLGRTAPAADPGAVAPVPNVAPNTVRVRVLNGSGASGQATDVSRQLKEVGFNVAGIGEADSFRYSASVIRFGRGQLDKARVLQSKVQGTTELREDLSLRGIDVVLITGGEFRGIAGAASSTPTSAAPPTTAKPGAKPAGPTTTAAPANPAASC